MSSESLFHEGRFTEEYLEDCHYGTEKYGEFLKYCAEQGEFSKIENMIQYCLQVHKEKYGTHAGIGFATTIPMSNSDKKEEKLAGYILTHQFMMKNFKIVKIPDKRKIQFVQLCYNKAIEEPWVHYQIEAYFNGTEAYKGFDVGSGFPCPVDTPES